jgi:hypothetical protein
MNFDRVGWACLVVDSMAFFFLVGVLFAALRYSP